MAWRIGVDSGGTFTDVCLFNENDGQVQTWKVPSTPDDPSRAIAQGISEGLERVGARSGDVSYFGHGTTVGTNALIQHRGVRTGLITSDGFSDLLEIGRQKRPDLYDSQADKEPILVARDLRLGVPERVRHDGSVEIKLDEVAVRDAARALRDAGAEAVAICFLYSFVRPEHEQIARRIVEEEFPEAFVSTSHEVAPEFREYERMSTVTVNAYLGPVMQGYINRLAERVRELGLKVAPRLTQSNGGVIGFEAASRFPTRTVLSGPSTGVVAAQALARQTGITELITFDVGGTSSDVALLSGGVCKLVGEATLHGYPIKAPMLDIHTVGAGGGSIATVDSGGLLKVGPRSAGAFPGPVCYDQGNDEPTVTDANVVLQTLNPTHLLGGRMAIDQGKAKAAIGRLADVVGLDVMATAQGIISVVVANMARAIRVISVQRGYDPRDYTLVAFGGAGPLHAARLARELEMQRILVPLTPGIMCATGLLQTDLRADIATTSLTVLGADCEAQLASAYDGLELRAAEWFIAEAIPKADRVLERTVDARYVGQNYEIAVEVPAGPVSDGTIATIRRRFEEEHRRLYGFVAEHDPIQLVTFRVGATGLVAKAEFRRHEDAGTDASSAKVGARDVWMPEAGGFVSCPIYDRALLRSGNRFAGPAIVEQMDTTTILLPEMVATVEPHLNLILEFLA
jgi:N-methylhydantoinase A